VYCRCAGPARLSPIQADILRKQKTGEPLTGNEQEEQLAEEQIAALTTTEKVIATVCAVACAIGAVPGKFAEPIS
jgi:cell division protein FtsL